uniref:Uncharacterized protein n=1 Tax=viral metagenome TaxID=1070528 RepID=A0A6C0ET88_9ZZZZ
MLSFVLIEENEMVKGDKYKIEENSYNFNKTFIGIYNGTFYDNLNTYSYLLWLKTTFVAQNKKRDDHIGPTYFETMRMSMTTIYDRKFYKLLLSKEKIQQAMEQRSVNIILQNITGDKTFKY